MNKARLLLTIYQTIPVDLEYAKQELDNQNYDYYNNECPDYAPYHIMQYTPRVEISSCQKWIGEIAICLPEAKT
jgi:hypothetical protein